MLEKLRSAGVEPLLVKGWAIARHYPEAGLRPYSDIDLIVRPDEYDRARSALAGIPDGLPIDLHAGIERFDGHSLQPDGRSFDDLAARASEVPLGETTVRVLGSEDHLRLLSLHALRHGVCRPIWLCDLAVALDVRSAAFDWARCLGEDRRIADWVTAALGLAHQLIDAAVDDTPAAGRAADLPGWLAPWVLRRWSRSPFPKFDRVQLAQALLWFARDPARLWERLVTRWDRPIEYALELRCPLTARLRWPIQLAGVARRLPSVARGFYRRWITRTLAPVEFGDEAR